MNCAGIDDQILKSELFGHVKGSFTGADSHRDGLLKKYQENAVIFLDELGDASKSFQTALLRVLETGDFKALGKDTFENVDGKTDFTIIAATSKLDKIEESIKHRFMAIYVPPLRDRGNDIIELTRKFCIDNGIQYICKALKDDLLHYQWPGNVRQLKRSISEAAVYCKITGEEVLQVEQFHSTLLNYPNWGETAYINPPDSDILKISDLSETGYPTNIDSFLNPNPPEPPRVAIIEMMEASSKSAEESKKRKAVEKRRQLREERDSALITISNLLIEKFGNISSDEIEQLTDKTFEKIAPKDWHDRFWEYHAKKGRRPKELEEKFPGTIKRSKASRKLIAARERIRDKSNQQS